MEKKCKSTTKEKKKISKDLLFYKWYSHVGTFIKIHFDDASRA